jgi:hypothetical protein
MIAVVHCGCLVYVFVVIVVVVVLKIVYLASPFCGKLDELCDLDFLTHVLSLLL